jgi:hypothetical protein
MLRHLIVGFSILQASLMVAITSSQAFDDSKYPDWSGQWVRVNDGGPPRYDPSKPGRKQDAPLKPEYRARHEASIKDQEAGGFGLDMSYACLPQGMPRQMSGQSPFEFLFSANTVHIIFENSTIQRPRRIYTDGREWPKDLEPTFTGYSLGKWSDLDGDGVYDTLEVETRNIRSPRTWDNSGMPMADDNGAVIKERLYLDKANPHLLRNEITTTDNSLTQSWAALKQYRRVSRPAWVEHNCTEGNPHVGIGKEVYFLSGDGRLMPTRKGQEPPDLTFFKNSR